MTVSPQSIRRSPQALLANSLATQLEFRALTKRIEHWKANPHGFKLGTREWFALREHTLQQAFLYSTSRFNIVAAGRRSGKTMIGKRRTVRKAYLMPEEYDMGYYISAAPTHTQAKRLFWGDLKKLVDPKHIVNVRESTLELELFNGAILMVVGLDAPSRIEGVPLMHVHFDEYADMRPDVWGEHVRPALADRRGTADFTGVPEGRNHFYDLAMLARSRMDEQMMFFTWVSADILPAEEIEAMKAELDPLVFDQEANASFVTFAGQAYYNFSFDLHCDQQAVYNPEEPIHLCFDFNESPGVAIVAQMYGGDAWAVDEVHIPLHSKTTMVCRKIAEKYGARHEGMVYLYGDATGGAGGSAKVEGSDWDIIRRTLRAVFPERMIFRVPAANPKERVRVNAVNARLKTEDGRTHIKINPRTCPNLVKDFEGVRTVEGGSGEIDKKTDARLTHPTDAFGYFIQDRWPYTSRKFDWVSKEIL